jgi:uncharacterized membrane protein
MSDSAVAELIFMGAMMVLILILSFSATYLFFRQYRLEKENKDKINEQARAQAAKEYVEK